MVKHPVGNSVLEPAPFQEISPLQNKIIPISFLPRPPSLTSRPLTTAATSTQTTPDDVLHEIDLIDFRSFTNYTLGDISWLFDYFDSEDRLFVENTDNSTSKNMSYVVTGIILNSEVPDSNDGCSTPDGESGSCRIMSTCVQADFVDDYQMFLTYFCPIGRLAGVCCPYTIVGNNTTDLSTADVVD
ncbi:hypothetical protein L9F63_021600 [Diploptera punctata]|uniref:Clip domain-containing protein n=1 Tax=Diploptera punctata TaxID=6984 RepID=A0AAD7ZQL4_DIPPU|nr:hypothetical protein L9F63_021600 [Diploptera punctata]